MATASCQCIGCIRANCTLCQACRKNDRCLLRRCQRFAYSRESEETWQFESQQLYQAYPPLLLSSRSRSPPPPCVTPLKDDDKNNNHAVVNDHRSSSVSLPKMITTIHEDVKTQHHRPPPHSLRSACGNCSHCLRGACQLCPNCCNQPPKKCPFVVCETISYSSHSITSMERSARQALSLDPEHQTLTRLYKSLYGQEGFMTRQKAERQKEKETVYMNIFGDDVDDTPHRQIMLRSRFPRAPTGTSDKSVCDSVESVATPPPTTTTTFELRAAQVTPCHKQVRNVLDMTRTDRDGTYSDCRHRKIIAYHSKPNLREFSIKCQQQTKDVSTTSGRKRKAKDKRIVTQSTSKAVMTDRVMLTHDTKVLEAMEPRQNMPQSRMPPINLFADVDPPLNMMDKEVIPVAPFRPKSRAPCRRCRTVTVCGLCFECNRIENIHGNDRLFPSPLADYNMDTPRKAHWLSYIQSLLKVAIQKLEKVNSKGVSSLSCFASNPLSARSAKRKVKVKFDSSSYTYMEQLWRERDHLYLFGDDLLNRPASFIAGIDASPRRENQRVLDEAFRAHDGGGPTRQFLSMFWRYLPKITLTNTTFGEYRIFEETNNYLRPLCDDRIYRMMEDCYKLEETAVYRSYRAFGRIVGFCILHQYHISHNVLSKIHRNYLFRGVSPKEIYDISDLLYYLKDSMGRQGNADDDKILDDLRELLDCKFHTEPDFERKLRDYVYKVYIEQNMIFLQAVKEGMRLDLLTVETIPETFHSIDPLWINELYFGRTTFDVEDVIAALQPVYAGEDKCRLLDHPLNKDRLAIQKRTLRKAGRSSKPQGAFVNVLRTLSSCDKDFLTSFVLCVTGYNYLPVTLKINIEFNNDQMPNALPEAYTCEHTLLLPGLAYEADENLIQEKLCMALNNFTLSKSAFNMK